MNGNTDQSVAQVEVEAPVEGMTESGVAGEKDHAEGTKARSTKKGKGAFHGAHSNTEIETVMVDPVLVEVISHRAKTDTNTIDVLVEMIREGVELEPLNGVALKDGRYKCSDGEHRRLAYLRLERDVPVKLNGDSERDIFIKSLSANAKHGLKRTNADKRNAVRAALEDEMFKNASHSDIARLTGVSHTFVANTKKSLLTFKTGKQASTKVDLTKADGSGKEMETENTSSAEHSEDDSAANRGNQSISPTQPCNVTDDSVAPSTEIPLDVKVDPQSILIQVLAMLKKLPGDNLPADQTSDEVISAIQRELERLRNTREDV